MSLRGFSQQRLAVGNDDEEAGVTVKAAQQAHTAAYALGGTALVVAVGMGIWFLCVVYVPTGLNAKANQVWNLQSPVVQTFTTAGACGSGVPPSATSAIITLIAGGGGGGGVETKGTTATGGGGGGGGSAVNGYRVNLLSLPTFPTSITCSVAAGGTAGLSDDNPGGVGGNSFVTIPGFGTITAYGGGGGQDGTAGIDGGGGGGSTGAGATPTAGAGTCSCTNQAGQCCNNGFLVVGATGPSSAAANGAPADASTGVFIAGASGGAGGADTATTAGNGGIGLQGSTVNAGGLGGTGVASTGGAGGGGAAGPLAPVGGATISGGLGANSLIAGVTTKTDCPAGQYGGGGGGGSGQTATVGFSSGPGKGCPGLVKIEYLFGG